MRDKRPLPITVIAASIALGTFLAIGAIYYTANVMQGSLPNVAAVAPSADVLPDKNALASAQSDSPSLLNVFETGGVASSPPKAEENWITAGINILFRLTLAVVLATVLAFRPRKNIPLLQRNLSVSQTQILLAVVGAALMMIVGDNAARAFAIFAAVSLVRFRTNIRDPKEITVLLISLALGLAAGVGRWELGIALCLFALVLLWALEYKESEQVFRSMELAVKTKNTVSTQELLKRIFGKYKLDVEVREIEPTDENTPIGTLSYYLNLPLTLSTSRMNEKIFALDPHNIESIQWQQSKNGAAVYQ